MRSIEVVGQLLSSLGRGEWIEAVGRVIHWRFLHADGQGHDDWTFDFRQMIQAIPHAPEVTPDAVITVDLGAAECLLSPTATADDLHVAVKARLVTVTGDTELVLRLVSAALRQ